MSESPWDLRSCYWVFLKFLLLKEISILVSILLCKRCFFHITIPIYYTATQKTVPSQVNFQYEIKACSLFSKHLIWRHLALTESYHLHSACSQCVAYFSRLTVHAPYSSIFNHIFQHDCSYPLPVTSCNTQDNIKRILYPHTSTYQGLW